MSDYDDRLD